MNTKRINIPIKIEKEFVSCNILKAELEHNGMQGGDAGHGGFVKIKLKDQSSTCMFLNGQEASEIELEVRGDSERETLIEALKMIVAELELNKYDNGTC